MNISNENVKRLEKLSHLFPRSNNSQKSETDTTNLDLNERIRKAHEVYSMYDTRLSSKENEVRMVLYFMMISDYYSHVNIADLMKNSSDNVFEIYDFEYNQLYRSASFMQFETYDMMDLMTHSNFVLYQREEKYSEGIMRVLSQAIEKQGLVEFDIPAHPVWEKFGKPNHNYYWMMKLGYMFPIFRRNSSNEGEMAGMFLTHSTQQIFKPISKDLTKAYSASL